MGRQFAIDSCGLGGAELVFLSIGKQGGRGLSKDTQGSEIPADPPRQLGGPHKKTGKLWQ